MLYHVGHRVTQVIGWLILFTCWLPAGPRPASAHCFLHAALEVFLALNTLSHYGWNLGYSKQCIVRLWAFFKIYAKGYFWFWQATEQVGLCLLSRQQEKAAKEKQSIFLDAGGQTLRHLCCILPLLLPPAHILRLERTGK